MKYWGNFNLMTYVALRPGASVEAVNAKIKSLLKKHNPEGTRDELFLHPYTRLRLHSKFTNGKPDGGRIEYVRLFSVVAIFILVIACINFMNLATARSAQRAREVGVRKVIGAAKKYLVAQFMGEAILVALLAMLLAMLLVDRLLPVFNEITGKNIAISLLDPQFLLLFLGIAFFTGMLSGSYPALFLSSLKPVSVLKGTLKFKPSAVYLRQGLVVFQFMLSIVLIIGTLIIYYQINYIKNKNLGIDRENVLMVGLNSTINKHQAAFMHDLQQVPGITAITTAEGNPLQVSGTSGDIDWPGKPKKGAAIAPLQVGYDFIRTMNIKLTAGRDFSREIRTDTSNYIINEAAARMMEMKEPLHQVIGFWQGKGRIIGVMQDYHLQSLHQAIGPLILVLKPTEPSLALIKVSNKNLAATLAGMEQTIKKYNPEEPFEYQFLDEAFENQYKSETIIGKLTSFFAAIAIVISCLGLFGLALFTAEQRTKEIGIRKVLGASVGAIVGMLSKDFLKLVLVANVIAWPLSWYFMQTWLQSFEYRIPIGWWIFALAGGATLFIALLTVSFQAVRAAVTNPVQALRRE
jgi:ABC-type antimicrobial peptide transport system permease subunit